MSTVTDSNNEGKVICPFCNETIAEGAIKCKHCESTLVSDETQQSALIPGVEEEYDIHAKINTLDLSDGMKAKMHDVHDNIQGTILGLPNYGKKNGPGMISFVALFFSFIYYLVKGMWRKALSLLIIGFIINIIVILLNISEPFEGGIGAIIIGAIACSSAYYDIYRHKVLNQSFWW